MTFTVEKSWLTQNGVDKSEVVLLRHADNQWNEIATTLGTEGDTKVEYTAMLPGFSFFAIGERGAAADAIPAPVTEEPAAEPSAPTPAPTSPTTDGDAMMKEEGGSLTWLWVVLVLVAIGAVVYFVKKRK